MQPKKSKIRRNLTGQRFGRLTVVEPTEQRGRDGEVVWDCLCDCSKRKLVSSKQLLAKRFTQSCGCAQTYNRIDPNRQDKRCSRCQETKHIDSFHKTKNAKDGHSPYCKPCWKIKTKEQAPLRRKWVNEYNRRRYKESVNRRLIHNVRVRIRQVLRAGSKAARTIEILGCSTEALKHHLESQFLDGMSWDNHGSVWEVDHILPCASFDLTDPEQQRKCFHYTNLRPLSCSDNRSRGALFKAYGTI